MVERDALERVASWLACPHCSASLSLVDRTVRCTSRHAFDVARQGYVNLAVDDRHLGAADTADMVVARVAVHERGVLGSVGDAVGEVAAQLTGGGADVRVVDVGAGTGHHTAAVLDRLPGSVGVAIDRSVHAARRAARAHPLLAAVVADAWGTLPIQPDSVDLALHVFAPRNPTELRRVLRPGGGVVVAHPRPDHLAELRTAVPVLDVDPAKPDRLAAAFADGFDAVVRRDVHQRVSLPHDVVRDLVAMGPSAHHLDADALAEAVARLPDPYEVSVAVEVHGFTRTV